MCLCVCKEIKVCSPLQYWDKKNCECVCKEVFTSCPAGTVWNPHTCKCAGCEQKVCPGLFVWQQSTCQCVCPYYTTDAARVPPPPPCPAAQFDEKCCQCIDCDANSYWNPDTCTCDCKLNQDQCPPGTIFDKECCECIVKPCAD